MGYLSIRQTSKKWNLSARWINDLCKENRIPGATKLVLAGQFPKVQKNLWTQELKAVST